MNHPDHGRYDGNRGRFPTSERPSSRLIAMHEHQAEMNHGWTEYQVQGSSIVRLTFCRVVVLKHHLLTDRGKESPPVDTYCSSKCRQNRRANCDSCAGNNLSDSCDLGTLAPAHLKPTLLAGPISSLGLCDPFQTQPLFRKTSVSILQSDFPHQFQP